jgi:prevent-host-death family protein
VSGASIPIRELQAKCSQIMHRVEQGERFTVTVNKRPVAQVIPVDRRRAVPFHEALHLARKREPIPRGEPQTRGINSRDVLIDASLFSPDDANPLLPNMVDVLNANLSVITLGELTCDAMAARKRDRAKRIAILAAAESHWDPLPVNATVAREFGRLMAALKSVGARMPDLRVLVAATAAAHGFTLVTRTCDYDELKTFGLRLTHL